MPPEGINSAQCDRFATENVAGNHGKRIVLQVAEGVVRAITAADFHGERNP